MSHHATLCLFTFALCVVFAFGSITTNSTVHHSNQSSHNATASSEAHKGIWKLETILLMALIVLMLITICVMCCLYNAWNRTRSNKLFNQEWKMTTDQRRHCTWPKGPIPSPKQSFERPTAKSITKEVIKSLKCKDSPRTEPTVTSGLTSFKTVISEMKAPPKPIARPKSAREDDSTVTRFMTCNDAFRRVPSAAEFEITADPELEIGSEHSVKLIPKNDPQSLMSLESESIRQAPNGQVKQQQPQTSLIQPESVLAIGSGTLLPNTSDASFRTAQIGSFHLFPKERVTLRSPSSSSKSAKKSGSKNSDF